MRVLITRPRPEAEALARELEARGHQPLIQPLLAIELLARPPPAVDGVQAIIVTSANAAPALAGLAAAPPPVIAVGGASARAARAAGIAQVTVAGGDATGLARHLIAHLDPGEGALLHVCGADVRPGLAEPLAAAGFELRRHVVYRAVPARELAPPVVAALRERRIAAVLLFSPRTAATFAALVLRHDLAACLAGSEALCLSAAIAEAAGAVPWRRIRIAARPETEALLRLLDDAG